MSFWLFVFRSVRSYRPFRGAGDKAYQPGKCFYKQKRLGKNGKIFEIMKFRSMAKDAEKDGAKWAEKETSE